MEERVGCAHLCKDGDGNAGVPPICAMSARSGLAGISLSSDRPIAKDRCQVTDRSGLTYGRVYALHNVHTADVRRLRLLKILEKGFYGRDVDTDLDEFISFADAGIEPYGDGLWNLCQYTVEEGDSRG